MGSARGAWATTGAVLVMPVLVVPVLVACGGVATESRELAAVDQQPVADVWPLSVGQRAVVVFPEDDYTGWILWSQAIAEADVAVLIDCPDDTSGLAFADPRGGACVEAVGPGTATLVWTDPDGVDAYVSTIVVSE